MDLDAIPAGAVEAVRRALRRRSGDAVPHALRRVVAWSGPRLPPPLYRTLLDAIEDDAELRTEAVAFVEGDEVARAFLERGQGWWRTIAEAAVERSDRSHDAADRADRDAAERTRRDLDETRSRLTAAQGEIGDLRTRLDETRAETAGRLARARADDMARADDLERRLARSEAERDRLQADLDQALGEIERLRSRPVRQRRRVAVEATSPVRDDPLAFARDLDLAHRSLTSRIVAARSAPAPPGQTTTGEWSLPQGLAAGDPRWIEWLGTIEQPFRLVVDGHNVVFNLTSDRERAADAMRRVEGELRRLRTLAAAPIRITVVYDSSQRGERPSPRALGGLDVRFAPAGVTADDEIVALAGDATDPVVVVTSDRELGLRVAATARLVVAGEALVAHVRTA